MKLPTFLKWAGGKRKILDKLDQNLPPEGIKRYFEPYLGSASVFFYMKQKYKLKYCMISDINKDLINTFKDVRDHPKEIIKFLKYFKQKNSESYYYFIRDQFNKGKIKEIRRSAAFIYLNKTCYNGLYRVNSKGEFNVPNGKYQNPEIFNEETIFLASKLLKDVKIKCQDYEKIKDDVEEGDFVYLDPCYDPLTRSSFANYTPKRYSYEDNERLARFVTEINRRGALVLLSNNITKNIKKLYTKKEGFNKIKIRSFRSIGSKNLYRGYIQEFLIKNY